MKGGMQRGWPRYEVERGGGGRGCGKRAGASRPPCRKRGPTAPGGGAMNGAVGEAVSERAGIPSVIFKGTAPRGTAWKNESRSSSRFHIHGETC